MKQAALALLFAVPFGAQAGSGTIAPIPQTSTAIGRASMALGFPVSCMTPLAAGGNPPYGQDLNGILNMLSTAAQASELGMMRSFSASYAATIGGYPAGATVAHPTITGRFLVCAQDGNENDPAQSMAGWLDPMAGFQPAGNYQIAGNYALAPDLAAEIQRAEAAEATLTPLSAFTGSLTPTGWCRLPSGLIFQWGVLPSTNGTFSFPTTFPSRCFIVMASNLDAEGQFVDNAFASASNNSQFYIATKASSTGGITGFGCSWFAIGI